MVVLLVFLHRGLGIAGCRSRTSAMDMVDMVGIIWLVVVSTHLKTYYSSQHGVIFPQTNRGEKKLKHV